MKFSVLLPTRNRLDLLSYAIETVRRQDYPNWEIIVSDNCSDQDIPGYVRSLCDDRIKYSRSPKLIPVTDNWNNALDLSSGDYIIMLGDDDGLMKGYFSTLREVIEKHDTPDLIYTSALLYAYPSVMPGFPDGFLLSYANKRIYRSASDPFWLEKSEAARLAQHSLNFRMRFEYNMQFSLVRKKFIEGMMKYGPFYQSPYPDYYASNAMMLKANRILVVPKPLVTIGISPKSFGFYYFNNLESKGNEFLQNVQSEVEPQLRSIVLPGTDMNTSWLLSMETLVKNFGGEFGIRANRNRYRFLQICAVYAKVILGRPEVASSLDEMRRKMTLLEHLLYRIPLSILAVLAPLMPKPMRALIARGLVSITGSHQRDVLPKIEGKYITILDVFYQVPSR
jgi:glycosyltransferase involved in cell wall biosynthesis